MSRCPSGNLSPTQVERWWDQKGEWCGLTDMFTLASLPRQGRVTLLGFPHLEGRLWGERLKSLNSPEGYLASSRPRTPTRRHTASLPTVAHAGLQQPHRGVQAITKQRICGVCTYCRSGRQDCHPHDHSQSAREPRSLAGRCRGQRETQRSGRMPKEHMPPTCRRRLDEP